MPERSPTGECRVTEPTEQPIGTTARRGLRYELIGCALHGHRLVGVDAAEVRAEDAALAREHSGLRWHRCLRCDLTWLTVHDHLWCCGV
jgi:hypothetical protein